MTSDRTRVDGAFVKRAAELDGKNPEDALALLYRFGIVGFVKKGGGGRGWSEVAWHYRDPKQKIDAGARNFRVHWSLREYLDLVE